MLTQAEVQFKLNYYPDTGIFTRKIRTWKSKPNDVVGSNCNKYIYVGCNGKQHYAHRLAWLYTYGYWPTVIDHINGDTKDNRLCNLREATISQNSHNSKKPKNNTSGIKGVYFHKKSQKWMARVHINYKCIYLGIFANIEDAKEIVINARKEIHGEFARN
jgi:hypothetical protein